MDEVILFARTDTLGVRQYSTEQAEHSSIFGHCRAVQTLPKVVYKMSSERKDGEKDGAEGCVPARGTNTAQYCTTLDRISATIKRDALKFFGWDGGVKDSFPRIVRRPSFGGTPTPYFDRQRLHIHHRALYTRARILFCALPAVGYQHDPYHNCDCDGIIPSWAQTILRPSHKLSGRKRPSARAA